MKGKWCTVNGTFQDEEESGKKMKREIQAILFQEYTLIHTKY